MLSSAAVEQYLDHTGVTLTDSKPTLADLRAIHRAHACRVPFENLCTVRNHKLVSQLDFETALPRLDQDELMHDIFHQKRYKSAVTQLLAPGSSNLAHCAISGLGAAGASSQMDCSKQSSRRWGMTYTVLLPGWSRASTASNQTVT